MSKEVEVLKLPMCDLCDDRAQYDVFIPGYRTWGYVCEKHFKLHGCKLGTGCGQKLIVKGGVKNDN